MLSKLKRPILILIIVFICFQLFEYMYRIRGFQSTEEYEQGVGIEIQNDRFDRKGKGDLTDIINEVLKDNLDNKEHSFSKTETTTSTTTTTTTMATTTTEKEGDVFYKNESRVKVKLPAASQTDNNVTDAVQVQILETMIKRWKTELLETEKTLNGSVKAYHGRDLLKDTAFKFDSNFKNPCWFDGRTLKCLPYVYLIGVKKCGTSDLFYRLSLHPDFVRPGFKEAQWFARKRFKYDGMYDNINEYVKMFSSAASKISKQSTKSHNGTMHNYVHITGEGSPSNLHLNTHWKTLPGNENLKEPKYVILDYIRHFTPDAKIIIVFRDPVDRLYSDFYHEYGTLMETNTPNPRQFHRIVTEGVKLYQDCFKRHSVRRCAYEPALYERTKIQMQLGIYYIFWQELTRLFPREQILVLQNENLPDKHNTMTSVYKFLNLRNLAPIEMRRITLSEERYHRSMKYSNKGPMLNETYDLLYEFYKPFNKQMAKLTNDDTFLYEREMS